jgi:ADP-L-glycero-D-manno-heptose 6-epimerase
MIIVTGGAGFIGSCLISKLNREGYRDVVAVDDFSKPEKNANLDQKSLTARVDREHFFEWIEGYEQRVQFIFHLGARTDTAEPRKEVFDKLNLDYSKKIWQVCVQYGLPLIYASSAATYGLGEQGFHDSHEVVDDLKPLNLYGESKLAFDQWALGQTARPYFWAGIKFFNVYGPNEYHKGRMASVIYHAYHQLRDKGEVRLFRSHHPDYDHGQQKRDFIYVKDVVEVLFWLMLHRKPDDSGLYNLGTGQAQTFQHLAESLFQALDQKPEIKFIDTPKDIRDKYQYFTQASMDKLRAIGYDKPFYSLKSGIRDYVKNYLEQEAYY